MSSGLTISHLRVTYPGPPAVRAVDDLSLSVAAGECLGILGESGQTSTFGISTGSDAWQIDPLALSSRPVARSRSHAFLYGRSLVTASNTLQAIRSSGRFAVNVLTTSQEHVARRFALKEPDDAKFRDVAYALSHETPVIDGALTLPPPLR